MNTETLIRNFEKIGAKVEIRRERIMQRHRQRGGVDVPYSIDVAGRGRDEHFVLRVEPDAEVEFDALAPDSKTRHLILQARPVTPGDFKPEKFLMGHDEMHFFAAALPNGSPVNVEQAKKALMTDAVRHHVDRAAKRGDMGKKDEFRRKSRAFVRQGEWFFIPQPNMTVDPGIILKNEPLVRVDGGKPHMMEEACRFGGEPRWVWAGSILEQLAYEKLQAENPKKARAYRQMRLNPRVYCRGKIRHPDHHTLDLGRLWHLVEVNGEIRGAGLGFLD